MGYYCGHGKPVNMSNFLEEFVEEVKYLTENGITSVNGSIPVEIICFCCDSPAKSDILGIKGHGGYFSCTKCTVKGTTNNGRRIFTDLNCQLRTNESFRSWKDLEFRRKDTPLIRIPGLDFVNAFVLDYMHLVLLGVTRTMLLMWYNGNIPHKLSRQLCYRLSENILKCRDHIPIEFSRKCRDLKLLLRWKAVEFRLFILYIGPISLKTILNEEKYNNFLSLHVAMTILLSTKLCKNDELRQYARSLLRHFVETFMVLYSEDFITHNFHGLVHIVDDADYFVKLIPNFTLDLISAFKFESFLQKVKRMVRGYNKPLEQIGRRLVEWFSLDVLQIPQIAPSYPHLSLPHFDGPLLPSCTGPQHKIHLFPSFQIRTTQPDNCCGSVNGDIIIIHNIAYCSKLNTKVVIGKQFKNKNDFYSIPCNSSSIGIFEVFNLSTLKMWPISEITIKYLCFPYKNHSYIVFPLLHLN